MIDLDEIDRQIKRAAATAPVMAGTITTVRQHHAAFVAAIQRTRAALRIEPLNAHQDAFERIGERGREGEDG